MPGSKKPFLVTTSGTLPERRTARGRSTTLHTSSPKAKALARASGLGLQACARAVLAFFIKVGRGTRLRSWFSAEQIADLLPRSAEMPTYSKHHVRRAIRQLVAVGLVRCVRVQPGECFPDKDAPDVDGGGKGTERGGNVVEVNVEVLLDRGKVWLAPPPALTETSLDEEDVEGKPEPFPGLPAKPADAAPAAPSGSGRVIIHDAGRVAIHAASSDPSSPPEKLNSDPAPPKRDAAPAAPAIEYPACSPPLAAAPANRAPARAAPANGASETPGAAPPAPARAAPADDAIGRPTEALTQVPHAKSESERRWGRKEQAKCQVVAPSPHACPPPATYARVTVPAPPPGQMWLQRRPPAATRDHPPELVSPEQMHADWPRVFGSAPRPKRPQ